MWKKQAEESGSHKGCGKSDNNNDPVVRSKKSKEQRVFNDCMADHEKGSDIKDVLFRQVAGFCLFEKNTSPLGDSLTLASE